MSFPLQTLLDLRRRAEEEAEQALAAACAQTARVEEEQGRLEECAAAARMRANLAPATGPATAGEAAAGERYRGRLADEARTADEAALTHRKGPLAAARTEEAEARERHAAARRERQVAEQASEREAALERRRADRRAEEVASDLAAARRRG